MAVKGYLKRAGRAFLYLLVEQPCMVRYDKLVFIMLRFTYSHYSLDTRDPGTNQSSEKQVSFQDTQHEYRGRSLV